MRAGVGMVGWRGSCVGGRYVAMICYETKELWVPDYLGQDVVFSSAMVRASVCALGWGTMALSLEDGKVPSDGNRYCSTYKVLRDREKRVDLSHYPGYFITGPFAWMHKRRGSVHDLCSESSARCSYP